MRYKRKGQAALEYLTTYGWGFLVILVVLGALAYFGFFSPTKYIPARCTFGSQLQCVDYQLQAASGNNNGVILLKLRNNFGDDIVITQVSTETNTIEQLDPEPPITIKKGESTDIISIPIPLNDEIYLIEGDRNSAQITITFTRSPTGPEHNVSGEVFATVQ